MKDARLLETVRIQTVSKKTEDEYITTFRAVLVERGIDVKKIDRVVLSSVVPALTGSITAMASRLFQITPIILEPSLYSKLPVKVLAADEIGTDLGGGRRRRVRARPGPLHSRGFRNGPYVYLRNRRRRNRGRLHRSGFGNGDGRAHAGHRAASRMCPWPLRPPSWDKTRCSPYKPEWSTVLRGSWNT